MLVPPEIPLRPLGTDLAWALCASLLIMSCGATVGARALAVLGDRLLSVEATSAEPGVVDRNLGAVCAGALMVQHWLVLLLNVPRCLLDVLRHMR